MEVRKEYWINVASRKKTPIRNYIHIRVEGTRRTLCGQDLNPEFDASDQDKWTKIEDNKKLTRKRICKNCKNAVKNLRDVRDTQIENSLKTVSRERDEEEAEPTCLVDYGNPDGEIELAYENLIRNADELAEKCEQTIKLLFREWREDTTNSLNTFLKMNAAKKLEQACKELRDN